MLRTAASALLLGQSALAHEVDLDDMVARLRQELREEYDAKLSAEIAALRMELSPGARTERAVDPAGRTKRRQLGSDGFSGIEIARDDAGISFGADGDVLLSRWGEGVLSVEADTAIVGDVNVTGGLYLAGSSSSVDDVLSSASQSGGGGWKVVYQLNIETKANYDSMQDVPYAVDNSADIAPDSFTRMGYHLQLDDEFVFVAMDAFTNNATLLGLPVDFVAEQDEVSDVSIVSNAASLANVTGSTGLDGSVEHWSNCYGKGSGSVYDNDDTLSSDDCYGSFQVHLDDGSTVLAYNGWSSASRNDLGIGPGPGEHPDWTFMDNTDTYDVKVLTVLVWQEPQQGAEAVPQIDALLDATANAAAADEAQFGTKGWKMVYQLDIENKANYDTDADVPYRVNDAAEVGLGEFSRIGYHLQLDDEFVFVSMDAFTKNASLLGIPVDFVGDQEGVSGMSVVSNSPSLNAWKGSKNLVGSIEHWSNCYGKGSDDEYTDDDVISSDDCYGSFQVHTQTGDTIFAYNGWSHSAYNDLGIGNSGGDHQDWTFANNAADYGVKRLSVFVYWDTDAAPAIDDLLQQQDNADGAQWELAYRLQIPDDANFDEDGDVSYEVDNSAKIPIGSFSKVAYHLQLDDEYVYVSMDAFTYDASKLGVPVDWAHEGDNVDDVLVVSNSDALSDYTGLSRQSGSIEHWSNCYGSGDGSVYDHSDVMSTSTDCYGSYQVHLSDGTTVFAYNGWSHSSYNDLGIGDYTGDHSDWTFANNADSYTVKTLNIFVLRDSVDAAKIPLEVARLVAA